MSFSDDQLGERLAVQLAARYRLQDVRYLPAECILVVTFPERQVHIPLAPLIVRIQRKPTSAVQLTQQFITNAERRLLLHDTPKAPPLNAEWCVRTQELFQRWIPVDDTIMTALGGDLVAFPIVRLPNGAPAPVPRQRWLAHGLTDSEFHDQVTSTTDLHWNAFVERHFTDHPGAVIALHADAFNQGGVLLVTAVRHWLSSREHPWWISSPAAHLVVLADTERVTREAFQRTVTARWARSRSPCSRTILTSVPGSQALEVTNGARRW